MTKPSASPRGDIQNQPLWKPQNSSSSASFLANFSQFVARKTGQAFGAHKDVFDAETYRDIHRWSVQNKEEFWDAVWDFCGVVGDKGQVVLEKTETIPWARWFPGSRLSYAENMLKTALAKPDAPAIICRLQDGPDRILNGREFCAEVSRWQQALEAAGIKDGDMVGVYLPNVPETVIILLAASNIGATFCIAGMDMGGDDLISRFSQVNPKIFIAGDGYQFKDKAYGRMDVIARAQKEIGSIGKTVLLPLTDQKAEGLRDTAVASDFLAPFKPQTIHFTRRDFNHPLYVLFSSGSTGAPKCFVHGTGGILLKHLAEFQLQCDVKPGDRVFYHATPSWMMWNWLVSGLASGATILMYDGNAGYPAADVQLKFTSDHGCTHHGTAAAVIMDLWRAQNMDVKAKLDLSAMRTMMYTGSVLPAKGFEYIDQHVKPGLQLTGIAGGTDLVGCFFGGNPFTPVYAGLVPGRMLGMAVEAWDDDGQSVPPGQAGELVCVEPFPSMPLRFANDPKGTRYFDSYFEKFDGKSVKPVWRHGDSIIIHEDGQVLVIGRSDATLNQGGVRIGTVEIYRQVDPFKAEYGIQDMTAVDFTCPATQQPITVLFLAFTDGRKDVPEELQKKIKTAVRNNIRANCVPTEIFAVPGVLKTPNGKLAEVVTKNAINGQAIKNPSLYGEDLVKHYQAIGAELCDKYDGKD